VGLQQSFSFSQSWVDTHVATGIRAGGGWARLSNDGLYRYVLGRRWGDEHEMSMPVGPGVTFIMLNPSVADAHVDDPTVRRCLGFAKRLGEQSLVIVNLYAYRSSRPESLFRVLAPNGPENDDAIRAACRTMASHVIIAAWGALDPRHRKRCDDVRDIVAELKQPLYCLGKTASGDPRHPLYLAKTKELRPWP
jgi:hypothetical protein